MGLRKWLVFALIVLIALGDYDAGAGMESGESWCQHRRCLLWQRVRDYKSRVRRYSTARLRRLRIPRRSLYAFPLQVSWKISATGRRGDSDLPSDDSADFVGRRLRPQIRVLHGQLVLHGSRRTLVRTIWFGRRHVASVKSTLPGAGVSWPYMNNAPLYGESSMEFKPSISMAPDTSGASLSLAPDVMSDVTIPTTKMSIATGRLMTAINRCQTRSSR